MLRPLERFDPMASDSSKGSKAFLDKHASETGSSRHVTLYQNPG
jgi:hypothetical protein